MPMPMPEPELLSGLAPVWTPDARILLLGSLPGNRSLAAAQYYAHPRNQFWQLVGHAIGEDLAGMAYRTRLECLNAHRIALWDVVATGWRKGSLDADLRPAETSDLAALVAKTPQLRTVGFNGQLAARIAAPQALPASVRQLTLPSSSAAHAVPLAVKQAVWDRIVD